MMLFPKADVFFLACSTNEKLDKDNYIRVRF
jgi:hypothetical protein